MRHFILILMTLSVAFAGDAKPLPYEAQKAVDAMEAQINKARRECLAKLDKVIGDITKTGNLELAMEVKAKEKEIEDAMPKIDLFGDANGVVGTWKSGIGNIIEYKLDGSSTHSKGHVGKWNINGNKLIVSWNTGNLETFILPIKNNTLAGSNTKGDSFTLTKVVVK